jgi:hypothetical protein
MSLENLDELINVTDRVLEQDPNGLDQHEPGSKLDNGKILAGVLMDFSLALQEVAKVGTFGANKYTRGGWQEVPNGSVRYTDALWRHLLQERHEPVDSDSGMLHAAHLAWNALARLELILRKEKDKDD